MQAREPGEVGARERLMGANEIEDEVAVNLAGRLVRSAPIAGEAKRAGELGDIPVSFGGEAYWPARLAMGSGFALLTKGKHSRRQIA